MQERRKTPRPRTYFRGVIAFNRRASTMDCLVRNFSGAGAKLALSNATMLPDKFDLTIERKERSFRASTVWRQVNEIGVRFLSEIEDDVPVPLEWVRRLRKCEDEKAALGRRVAQLSEPA
jgi:hypothetical protein